MFRSEDRAKIYEAALQAYADANGSKNPLEQALLFAEYQMLMVLYTK